MGETNSADLVQEMTNTIENIQQQIKQASSKEEIKQILSNLKSHNNQWKSQIR